MPFAKGNKFGGAKPGAGRKKSATTILKEQIQRQELDNAKDCLAFVLSISKDKTAPLELRLKAAESYMDRIMGKPKQALEHSGMINLEQLVAPDAIQDNDNG